jgi:hypothetical protein
VIVFYIDLGMIYMSYRRLVDVVLV